MEGTSPFGKGCRHDPVSKPAVLNLEVFVVASLVAQVKI